MRKGRAWLGVALLVGVACSETNTGVSAEPAEVAAPPAAAAPAAPAGPEWVLDGTDLIEGDTGEPLDEWGTRIVEHPIPAPRPMHVLGRLGPESVRIPQGALVFLSVAS